MQRVISFKVNDYDRQIEIKELTVRQIIQLAQSGEKTATGNKDEKGNVIGATMEDFKNFLQGDLLPLCTNLTLEEIIDFPPSVLREIYDKFKEVNKSFFDFAETVGLMNLLGELKRGILMDFSKMFVNLLNQDT